LSGELGEEGLGGPKIKGSVRDYTKELRCEIEGKHEVLCNERERGFVEDLMGSYAEKQGLLCQEVN